MFRLRERFQSANVSFVLASGSPRRSEILQRLFSAHSTQSSDPQDSKNNNNNNNNNDHHDAEPRDDRDAKQGTVLERIAANPRRRTVDCGGGFSIDVIPSTFEENVPKAGRSARSYTGETSFRKCAQVLSEIASVSLRDTAYQGGPWDPEGEPRVRKREPRGSESADAAAAGRHNSAEFSDARVLFSDGPPRVGGGGVVVVSCDTVVVSPAGVILEKPRSRGAGVATLAQELSGQTHRVLSAATIAYLAPRGASVGGGGERGAEDPLDGDNEGVVRFSQVIEETEVTFAPIACDDAEAYFDTGEPWDKAGGYGIQGLGGVFVEGIRGCYYNVMGLPLHRIAKHIDKITSEIEEAARARCSQ